MDNGRAHGKSHFPSAPTYPKIKTAKIQVTLFLMADLVPPPFVLESIRLSRA
jgi:hypothetical protein